MPTTPPLEMWRSARLVRRALLGGLGAAGAGALLAPFEPPAHAEAPREFVIVVNRKNPLLSVNADFLADAFLKKATHWDSGVTIRAADQRSDAPVRRAFSATVLRRSVAAVRFYWQQRIFAGRDVPPPEFDSEAAVILYVAKHEGGVGYVSPTAPLGDVRLIALR